MKHKLVAALSAVVIAIGGSFQVFATTAFVVPEGTTSIPTPPYADWGTAAACINDAVNYALSDDGADIDEIVLADGTHHTAGQMTIARALTIRGQGGRERVIVDAEGKCCQFVLNHAQAKLTGLAIQGVDNKSDNGGASMEGGGVSIKKGIVEDCILRNNKLSCSSWGGGAYLGSTEAVLSRCIVTNNVRYNATTTGGGVYADKGLIANCYIANNIANHGSAARITSIDVRLVNCFIRGMITKKNSDATHGLSGTFVNCVVVVGDVVDPENKEKTRVLVGPTDSYTAVNCAFVVTEAPEGGVPNAVDSLLTTEAAMDLEGPLEIPGSDSVLIDKGKPDDDMGAYDLGGQSRFKGNNPDIGCWENQNAEFSVSFVASGSRDVREGEALALVADVKNPPSGATLEYNWIFTPEVGAPIKVRQAMPTLSIATLPPAFYTVSLTATDTTSGASTVPFVRENYVYIAPLELLVSPAGTTGSPQRPYSTWATAATNIETALACALPGTSVVLGDGVHCTTGTITLSSAITIKGLNGRAAVTVAPCPCPSSAFVLDHAAATLCGLTITNAVATELSSHGGAVWIKRGVVEDCRITDATNMAGGRGVAVSVDSDESVLRRTIIDNCKANTTTYGVVHALAGLVENCLVNDCMAFCPGILVSGDGVFNSDKSKIDLAKITKSTAIVRNCTVVAGTSKSADYGMLTRYGGSVTNCILISGGLSVYSRPGTKTLDWALLDDGEDPQETAEDVSHCCVSSDSEAFGSSGVVSEKEKVFRSFEERDFTLRGRSPCVNAAVLDRGWMLGATDLVGAPRIINALPDIGCYESKYGAGLILMVR